MYEINSQKEINKQLLDFINSAKKNNPEMALGFSQLKEQFQDISFRV
jgi:hypothetical protein